MHEEVVEGPGEAAWVAPDRYRVNEKGRHRVIKTFVCFFNDKGLCHNIWDDVGHMSQSRDETISLREIQTRSAKQLAQMCCVSRENVN